MNTHPFTGEQVARKAAWLAFQASTPTGLGVMNYDASTTETQFCAMLRPGHCDLHLEYCQGRMMKLHIAFGVASIDSSFGAPQRDYQSWCTKYPTYEALFNAAIKALQ